jgi:hypothetical protein
MVLLDVRLKGSSMLRISPGKVEDFRYFHECMAVNAAVDRVIEAELDGVRSLWRRKRGN